MNRKERISLAREMRKQAQAWPAHLVELPKEQWPQVATDCYPLQAWRSRRYLVLRYEEPSLDDIEVRRLSICRVTIDNAGGWQQDIPWQDLQDCKRETGHGHWYAVEVYPRDRDLVNVANLRHLWLLSVPLPIGWFGP